MTPSLRNVPGVREVTHSGNNELSSYIIQSDGEDSIREEIATLIANRGWGLLRLQPTNMSLEEIFLSLTTTEAEKQ